MAVKADLRRPSSQERATHWRGSIRRAALILEQAASTQAFPHMILQAKPFGIKDARAFCMSADPHRNRTRTPTVTRRGRRPARRCKSLALAAISPEVATNSAPVRYWGEGGAVRYPRWVPRGKRIGVRIEIAWLGLWDRLPPSRWSTGTQSTSGIWSRARPSASPERRNCGTGRSRSSEHRGRGDRLAYFAFDLL